MKIFTFIFFTLAIILIGFNVTILDFHNILEGESFIALIGIMAVLCATVIFLIFKLSKSIEQKLNN